MSIKPNPGLDSTFARVISGPTRCKQSLANECDINRIVSNFLKTGVLPSSAGRVPAQFGDMSSVPNTLQDALLAQRKGVEAFNALPLALRKELGFNPANFEGWLKDPRNRGVAVKMGLLKPRKASVKPSAAKPAVPPTNVSASGSNPGAGASEGA